MLKNERNFEGFWTPFRTLQGVVLGSQNPLNSIIPEVRFSSLFPTPLQEVFRRRPGRDFGWFLDSFGIDFGRFLKLFERARPSQNFFKFNYLTLFGLILGRVSGRILKKSWCPYSKIFTIDLATYLR